MSACDVAANQDRRPSAVEHDTTFIHGVGEVTLALMIFSGAETWPSCGPTGDVVDLVAAMEPASVAGVLVWETRWAAPFASAARRAAGQLIGTGRTPIQAILASMEADEASKSEGGRLTCPLGPGRAARRGAIGLAVARAVAVVGTNSAGGPRGPWTRWSPDDRDDRRATDCRARR